VVYKADAYLRFLCSMKRLGFFPLPLDGMLVNCGVTPRGKCCDLMVSVLEPGRSGLASSPGWARHHSHSASLHPGVRMSTKTPLIP